MHAGPVPFQVPICSHWKTHQVIPIRAFVPVTWLAGFALADEHHADRVRCRRLPVQAGRGDGTSISMKIGRQPSRERRPPSPLLPRKRDYDRTQGLDSLSTHMALCSGLCTLGLPRRRLPSSFWFFAAPLGGRRGRDRWRPILRALLCHCAHTLLTLPVRMR